MTAEQPRSDANAGGGLIQGRKQGVCGAESFSNLKKSITTVFLSFSFLFLSNSQMTQKEVAHMMIAVLMAGQHTSSTTGTWMGLYMSEQPSVV